LGGLFGGGGTAPPKGISPKGTGTATP